MFGLDAELSDRRAEFLEDQRSEEVRRAVPAIDDQLQAAEIRRPEALLGILDVASARIIDPVGLPDLIRTDRHGFGFGQNRALHRGFEFVGQLVAIRAEDLQPVVFIRVM